MNRLTGRRIADEIDHIRQSITDILTTPVGSRVKRRTYGSLVPYLVDQPATPANRLRVIAATYMAVIRWEPRVHLVSASLEVGIDGKISIDLQGQRTGGPRVGASLNLSIPIQ